MPDAQAQTIVFPNGASSLLVCLPRGAAAQEILSALALPVPRALVVLNGGAARVEPSLQGPLAAALADGLAQVVAEEGITVITGGSDAGIFQLSGQGLARWGRTAPSIGVAVAGLVAYPGHPQGEASLEPNHSYRPLSRDRAGVHQGWAGSFARGSEARPVRSVSTSWQT
jgi:hypothetical protein